MARKSRNGFITSFVIPKEQLGDYMGKPEKAIPVEFLDRQLRQLSLRDIFGMKDKHPHPYLYASWFGHNARVFQLTRVDEETGELVVLDESEYYVKQRLEAIEQRLFDEAVAATQEGRPEMLRLYVY